MTKATPELDKSIGFLLVEFYEQMKALERDEHRGGKQATAIVMAINDIKSAVRRPAMGPQPPTRPTPMLTSYEILLRQGWKEVPGPNPNGDHWNDRHCYIFIMHHPERDLYHARIEATNIRDTCFEVIRPTLKEAMSDALNHLNK